MHVISNNGQLLFSGSRHECKQFIRKNNVKQYKFKERFTEKIAPVYTPKRVVDEDEAFFNLAFEDE